MIKRSSKSYINNLLDQNPKWKILDIGCGYSAHKNATTVCDVQDLSNHYKDKNFIQITNKNLPFKNKEFDFVIASHVIEHVNDVEFFIRELERISYKGYIELPTILEDNLVFENKNDHLWQMEYDDVANILLISKKIIFIEPILTVSSAKKFLKYFRQSLVLELLWANKIDFKLINKEFNSNHKLSRLNLLKKFFSKLFRNMKK